MPRTKAPKKEHPIKELLTYFDQAFRLRFGQPAPIVGARDAKLAQDLLKVYPIADLRRWVDAFFASFDRFIRESTYSFAVFKSCVGKLIAAESAGPSLTDKSVRTLKAIYEQP